MKIHTTNYSNTLIEVAEDCKVTEGKVPPLKPNGLTVANMQFDMIIKAPYEYTSDDVLFAIHAQKNAVGMGDMEMARAAFFAKGQACMRASPLPKQYGWGVHADAAGRVALVACDDELYKKMQADDTIKKVRAMRSKR